MSKTKAIDSISDVVDPEDLDILAAAGVPVTDSLDRMAITAVRRAQMLMPRAMQGNVELHRFTDSSLPLWSWWAGGKLGGNVWLTTEWHPPQFVVSVQIGDVEGDIRTTPDRHHGYEIQMDPREMYRPLPGR